MRTHTRRYLSAALAVLIGVAFVVTTNALSSATRNGLLDGVDAPYENADAVVSDISSDEAVALMERAEKNGDQASILGWSLLPVSRDGKLFGDQIDVGGIAPAKSQQWQVVEDGRLPSAAGEVAVDVNSAKREKVEVGDELQIGSGSRAKDVTVVGLVDSPSSLVYASVYVTWADQQAWTSSMYIDSVAYAGASTDELAKAYPDAKVQTADAYVADQQAEITNGTNVMAMVLLSFAAIALFVSILVIANTFSILFAQRQRDFALLRCVGATRRQIVRSVRAEALVLGVLASLLGLAAGTGLGFGLVALTNKLIPSAKLGTVEPSPLWYAVAFVVGVGVSLLASWLPTRRVVRVSPLAALRPDAGVDVRTGAGRWRLGTGLLLLGGGTVLLIAAAAAQESVLMLAGGFATFVGVLLFGPVLVPAAIRLAGAVVGRVTGPAGRLATGNAVRNPRRTAATTASLLVGVTLTTAVLTGMAGSRDAVAADMNKSHPIDVTLTATGKPLPDDLLEGVRRTAGVEDAIALPGAAAKADHGIGELELVAPGDISSIARDEEMKAPERGVLVVPPDRLGPKLATGDRVMVTVGDRHRKLRVESGEGFGAAGLVAPATLAALTDAPTTRAVWLRAKDGTDAEDLSGDLSVVAQPAEAEVASGLSDRAWVDLQLDIFTGSVLALLGIAVVIALIGIGNTLGLSVLERAREHALLRALGLTRRQLRLTLGVEAVLLSLVAAVLGTILGVTYAAVAMQVVVAKVADEVSVVLPFGQLAVVVLVAALAGLLSCLLPARRAAKVTPAAGLALD
ncbi:ABC transporter permease [Nocardioides speluncae]|uniref:ABC transporter permease n=1 Tax=Nocardioides speluncae TaxID=2670337 RepID=UPI0019803FC4|nr:FtsX-like permease family protein [Nocardioides speluncae]